jgi:antirestriction protein ArdC
VTRSIWFLCGGEGTKSHLPKGQKMKSEQIKQITSKAIEQLAAALQAGRSEALTNYLAAMARFRKYSLFNLMLVLQACPHATRVAGYRTWQSLGRYVKKGEKGIMILAPIFRKRHEADGEDDATDHSRALVAYRPVFVFDESQTAGADIAQIGVVNGDPGAHLVRLEEFVRAQGIALEYSQDIAPAKGMSEGGKITLLPGQTPAETLSTLAHEYAHSALHFSDRRAGMTKCARETEAEAVAFVVCRAIGLETGSAAADYIGLYNGDAALLLESLEHIQKAAGQILDALDVQTLSSPALQEADTTGAPV